jgi:CubicO group peptidase (beta-lactamase class C family)
MKSKMLLAFLLSLCLASSFAQDNRANQLDSIFSALYDAGEFNGNVLIAEDGKPLYQKSFGLANNENLQRLNVNSPLLLGSMSKQFTAFGIVLLKQQGRLNYDDNIQQYLPELPYKDITIRHLLTNTSGLPDYSRIMDSHWNNNKYASNQDKVSMLVKYHPAIYFKPGTWCEYSSTGYVILSLLIEKLSGISYQQFMQDNIFKPAGMKRTMIYTHYSLPRQQIEYAVSYTYQDSLYQYNLSYPSSAHETAGWEDGIVDQDVISSTTSDLLIWDQLLYNNKLIPADALQEIFTPAKTKTGETDYGFGWHIQQLYQYGKIAYHRGDWPGYIAYIERHMDSKKTIIILRNRFTPQIEIPIDRIRSILYQQHL